ncbi:MAG TPA: NAD(P)/FAD-dependent oxidoreductase [Nocardioidaceae bacterium]|nr:NAD(P)/FAD-dependent oxidoreductase [Nocardioidaceae bacterium]
MNAEPYDVIVVGARCAGSPTAMLLARRGHRVLLLDRARFPSDTVSTHLVHPGGVAALRRWGLLDRVVASGCPPIDTYSFDFGPFSLSGAPGTVDSPVAYSPRRTTLDAILLQAAADAGVEVREGFSVTDLVVSNGCVEGIRGHAKDGPTVTERAAVVVGADGVRSFVAAQVRPERYREQPRRLVAYYGYWSGLPMDGRFEVYTRPGRAFAGWETNDGLTVVVGGWPYAEFERNRADLENAFASMFDLAPDFARRMRAATLETRLVGAAVPNFFRRPFGRGWALVGDAGYNKDFITAQGIQDAFRDAELCASAITESLAGERAFDVAMAGYQATRDARVSSMYELTLDLAALQPPPPEMARLLSSMQGDQQGMDAFARMNAGIMSPEEFFAGAGAASSTA